MIFNDHDPEKWLVFHDHDPDSRGVFQKHDPGTGRVFHKHDPVFHDLDPPPETVQSHVHSKGQEERTWHIGSTACGKF